MSTQAVTPDPNAAPTSNVGAIAAGQAPPSPDASSLPPTTQPVPSMQAQPTAPAAAKPTSRLAAILGAVANVAETGLAGIPDRGRPSFVTGLGEGARAEKASEANQQAIKFKTFDDQVRMAELHNQDIKMQNDNQAQQDAHTEAELHMRSMANDLGVDYDTIANHGPAVMDHLTAQTALTGSASVPAGTHISADGSNIYMPSNPDSQATRDGQRQLYAKLAPALGLPLLPPNAQFVPNKNLNMMTNKINGFDIAGKPPQHGDLPALISNAQVQRDRLAKNGGSPDQLKTIDNMIGIYQANLDALDKNDADVKAKTKQAELDVENNPANTAAAGKKAGQIEQAKLNVTNSPANQAAEARGAGLKAEAEEAAKNTGQLDSVAYDPNYQNPDGTKGGNVVMNKQEAAAKGLQHYKANPEKLNAVVAGFNDVQNKINMLADVTTNPDKMTQVQGPTAAVLLKNGFGLEVGAFGTKVDLSNVNTAAYEAQLKFANQATRDYVTAMGAAHEAITQLPRLQTFGQSSRMTQQQVEAAQKMLPFAGDDAGMAQQKMTALQTTIDPLKKQVPHMPGAEQIPSWLEKKQRQQAAPQQVGSNLGRVARGSATDLINGLQ